jgi:ArsR family transcriptional regulator, virulence genes transcriptional regulator
VSFGVRGDTGPISKTTFICALPAAATLSLTMRMVYEQLLLWLASSLGNREVKTNKSLARQTRLLSAMANEKRLHILKIISEQESGVGDLALRVDLSQSALSQHLAKLRAFGLVATRRDAQTIFYSTRDPKVLAVLKALDEIYGEAD